ncbi:MAG: HlyD family efflux transporter periplasmic adaptor subunit [Microbacterium sp.]
MPSSSSLSQPPGTAGLDAGRRFERRVRAVSVRLWLALVAIVAVIAAGLVWGVFGAAPVTAAGTGAILPPDGLIAIRVPSTGQVVSTGLSSGAETAAGATLMTLLTPDGTTVAVTSPLEGQIVEASPFPVGSWVDQGQVVAQLLPAADADTAILFLDPVQAAQLSPGMRTLVSPVSAPDAVYGSIIATVESIDRLPSDADAVSLIFGSNTALAELVGGGGTRVVVRLQHADTPSGFAWTSGDGPDFAIDPTTLVSGTVIVSQRQPLSFLVG